MLTREQVKAASVDELLALLNMIESVTGWPVRVLTRSDAENFVEGYGLEALTDDEWRRVAAAAEAAELGCVSPEDWELFGETVLDVVRERPKCVECHTETLTLNDAKLCESCATDPCVKP